MTRFAVFAYGSLVDPASAALTLERDIAPPILARLDGWRRRWSIRRDNLAAEKTFALEPGGAVPPWIVGLNVEPGSPTATVSGALLAVSQSELERLDRREVRYDRVDVTEAVANDMAEEFDRIYAYTAKPANYAKDPPKGAVIVAAYLRTVQGAFGALGPGEAQTFAETTEFPHDVPVVEVRLVHDEIPKGNPRGW